MSWPIPVIEEKRINLPPNFKNWGGIFIAMVLMGGILILFMGKATTYGQILFYGVLPAALLWLTFFGLTVYRYERSINIALQWNVETERTKLNWQRWSRKQQRVVGNFVLTPEKEGVNSMLGKPENIPAYPEKMRSLSTIFNDIGDCFSFIDKEMEKQCPGYRHYLRTIIVEHSDKYPNRLVNKAVYYQWDLYPEYSEGKTQFCASDDKELNGLALLICLQGWMNDVKANYSEFITAQLIAADSFHSNEFNTISGTGRLLTSDDLIKALDMMYEYNILSSKELRHIWITGVDGKRRAELIQYTLKKQWPLPDGNPLISIDHSFGPQGPLILPVAVSLLTDAVKSEGGMQLLVSQDKNKLFSLCLITRELLL
ncbi:hypothetical protein QDZ74_004928 [Pluralibacter gergoviae]|uniref:hypothetical protein n=1 Tax=Pluralibacter gergoviae TaxID=61647 RepID=UPI000A3C93A7|nr:hypothetical protein [Pluralibacter gergoviae]EKV3545900.1 hypothetical protein [Pluralibacter gergoviae]EKV9901213.1 hypothetical protein [Pluralibacter gergoviae]EKV9932868.1 hypothetical protein [Pluralibacter gergoviae]EKW6621210.1 hypothetical protein [Pluralibacter gergoviae]EKW9978329.1 hypothetical protein [Pluralibacter gergoviae]